MLNDPPLRRQTETAIAEIERQARWREPTPDALAELAALRRQLDRLMPLTDGPGRPGWNDRVNAALIALADAIERRATVGDGDPSTPLAELPAVEATPFSSDAMAHPYQDDTKRDLDPSQGVAVQVTSNGQVTSPDVGDAGQVTSPDDSEPPGVALWVGSAPVAMVDTVTAPDGEITYVLRRL